MTTQKLINQYVTAHADNRWMDASELEALLTEFAERLKEPASEDLEQASIEHANKVHNDTAPGERIAACRYDFKAGAQWQKEKDQKELQIAEEHGILTGMNMERERIMKDAIEADIAESFTPVSESPNIYMHGFTCAYEEKESTPYVVAPCKVKLIIIKE